MKPFLKGDFRVFDSRSGRIEVWRHFVEMPPFTRRRKELQFTDDDMNDCKSRFSRLHRQRR